MNVLKALTAAILLISTAYAAAAKVPATNEKTLPAPAFNWGSPDDLDPLETELLKSAPDRWQTAPGYHRGAADLDEAALEVLKVRTDISLAPPAFFVGTPDDLATQEAGPESEKITMGDFSGSTAHGSD